MDWKKLFRREKDGPEEENTAAPAASNEAQEVPWETGEINRQKELDARREKRQALGRTLKKNWVPLAAVLVCLAFVAVMSVAYFALRNRPAPVRKPAATVTTVPEPIRTPEPTPTPVPAPSPEPEPEEAAVPEEIPEPQPEPGLADPAAQLLYNTWLTRISRQGAFESEGYDAFETSAEELVRFAYLDCRIRQSEEIFGAREGNSYYYTVSLETVERVLEEYFHRKVEEKSLRTAKDPQAEERGWYSFYKKGYFYFPAADGETYGRMSVVTEKQDLDETLFRLVFDVYSVDIPGLEPAGELPEAVLRLGPREADEQRGLEKIASGEATVRCRTEGEETAFYLLDYRVTPLPVPEEEPVGEAPEEEPEAVHEESSAPEEAEEEPSAPEEGAGEEPPAP